MKIFANVTRNILLQVNRIRELPQNSKIVATHTDSPDVSSSLSSTVLVIC